MSLVQYVLLNSCILLATSFLLPSAICLSIETLKITKLINNRIQPYQIYLLDARSEQQVREGQRDGGSLWLNLQGVRETQV